MATLGGPRARRAHPPGRSRRPGRAPPRPPRRAVPRRATTAAEAEDPTALGVPWRTIALVGLGLVLFYSVDTAVTAWGPVYLSSDAVFTDPPTSPDLYALATLPYLVATLLARSLGDAATARFGAPTVVRAGALTAFVGLGVVVLAPAATWPVAVLGFFVVGLGVAVVAPLAFSAAARVAGAAATRPPGAAGSTRRSPGSTSSTTPGRSSARCSPGRSGRAPCGSASRCRCSSSSGSSRSPATSGAPTGAPAGATDVSPRRHLAVSAEVVAGAATSASRRTETGQAPARTRDGPPPAWEGGRSRQLGEGGSGLVVLDLLLGGATGRLEPGGLGGLRVGEPELGDRSGRTTASPRRGTCRSRRCP